MPQRPCENEHPFPGENCRLCWCASQPGGVGVPYRRAWGLPEPIATPTAPVGPTVLTSRQPNQFRLLPCSHRGEATGGTVVCKECRGVTRLKVFGCDVHGACVIDRRPDGIHSCETCPDYKMKPMIEPAAPNPAGTVSKLTWAYGVTTVPSRRQWPLPKTLASLAAGGFDRPRLFVDGDDDSLGWKQRFGLDVTCRGGPPCKVVANWILSILELYHRQPNQDRYAIFQDDLVTYKHLKDYLDVAPYPDRGYLNLLTFPQNQAIAPHRIGWFAGVMLNGNRDDKYQKGLGAVALVFSNEALRTLFVEPGLFDKPKHPQYGNTKIDGGIVTAMNLRGWKEYVHNPSLVQHTGVISSREENPGRYPDAPSFLGEQYDARGLVNAKDPG